VKPARAAVKPVGRDDLPSLARVHRQAFPESALSLLGVEAVRRYYDWQLRGPHDAVALGAFHGPELIGFCVAGVFRGALSGFLRANRLFLARVLLTRPGLLSSAVVRDRARRGAAAVARSRSSRTTATTATGPAFGILAVGVAPAYRRQGIGRQLVEAAEGAARERGLDRITLTVDVTNVEAIAFYEALGWERPVPGAGWTGRMDRRVDPDRTRRPSP
jgi:ribosomal protein S18 acetylase RimI-like enzyme